MIDIRINIHCPDLVTAAGLLAGSMHGTPVQGAPVPPQEAPKHPVDPTPTPLPKTQPAAPVAPQTAPPENAVPVTPPPAPVAPTAGPGYTSADIARAGASLIQADQTGQMRATLQAMLRRHGIDSAMTVPAELIPTVANELKALGAKL